MTRALAAILLILLVFAGVQTYRLSSAHGRIDVQQTTIAGQGKKLSQKNSQLMAVNILAQSSNLAQTQLYAATEKNNALLRQRQRQTEDLKRENDALRRWSDTPLPDAAVRLRQRPAITGGESYRQWLSQNNPLPAGAVDSAH
ncbi:MULTISPECIES: Rz-like lysis system protein LysB [Pantoea]|uniref:Rz-like lysis system protein LysB n=1 Tax=Pantoea TaxID=53335 RepID=UPI00197D0031|nr:MULTISPECIES: Rz-like lysis system protein LysB [Pantoea]